MTINQVDYHSRPGLSSSQIAAFLTDPVKWFHQFVAKDWPLDPPTPAMEFGTLVHSMMEKGGPVALCVAVKPDGMDFRTKDGKAWLAGARDEERTIIDADQWESLNRIWQHVLANDWLRFSLERADCREKEMYWDDDEFGECRAKPDLICGNRLIDWKTTRADTEHAFIREIVHRFYDIRMAFYRRAVQELCDVLPSDVYLAAIQTGGSNSVHVYRLSDDWLDDADARLIFAVDEMKRFDLAEHLNRPPKTITQPRYSTLNLETV